MATKQEYSEDTKTIVTVLLLGSLFLVFFIGNVVSTLNFIWQINSQFSVSDMRGY